MGRMRPAPGEVLHFSEDPTITQFVPHVAATARQGTAYVWAVDAARAPSYWFPRQCPRVLAWSTPAADPSDVERIIGPGGGERVHAVDHRWLEPMRSVQLYAYRLPAEHFAPFAEPEPAATAGQRTEPSAHVSTRSVRPLGPPERVGDLFALHAAAGIQLRVLPDLAGFWAAVAASTLGFSGIRLRNADIT
jgi:hypothetical protein